jgi:hypothetical protein
MSTEGIAAVFLETHNWGKTAKFLQTLGFELEFATDHESGQLRNGEGPPVFVAEVPPDRELRPAQLVLKVHGDYRPEPALEVTGPFENTHYGTRETTVLDPDGRAWTLQAPAAE